MAVLAERRRRAEEAAARTAGGPLTGARPLAPAVTDPSAWAPPPATPTARPRPVGDGYAPPS